MIKIEPDGFYTRSELVDLFRESGVDWDSLSGRIQPKKVFRGLYLGRDILDSWRQYQDKEEVLMNPVSSNGTKGKRSGSRTGDIFDNLISEVRGNG